MSNVNVDMYAPTVTCEGCGVCCLHMSTPPYDEDEREMLREWHPAVFAELEAVGAIRQLQYRLHPVRVLRLGYAKMSTSRC
jgi:hypothetical protein